MMISTYILTTGAKSFWQDKDENIEDAMNILYILNPRLRHMIPREHFSHTT